jgi:peptide/nickel transport system substrate-binding protein
MARRWIGSGVGGGVVLLALVLAAPLGAEPLRVGLRGLPAVPDPATALEGAVPLISRQVFDTLVQYREGSSDVEPSLAVRWSPSRDGLAWTFTLREGVRFHDGTPLRAQHVVASFERQLSPDHPAAPQPVAVWPRLLRGLPGVVKEVRALDARTVRFHLLLPYAPLLTALAHPGFSVVQTVPGEDGSTRWLGTGPFKIAEVGPGRLVLEAFPGHWGGAPRLEGLVFFEVADEQGEAELEARRLDVWIPTVAPPRTEGALSTPGWRVGLLALQTEKEPFSKKKVRQAIAAGLDPALIAVAVERVAVPLQSFLPPGVWGRREGSPILGADPAGARRLLAEARQPEGLAPALLLGDAPEGVDGGRLAEAIRLALGAAGIWVRPRLEPPETVARLAQAGDHEMVLTEASVAGGDPHLFLYPLSTTEGATKGPGALNLAFFRDRHLDDLLIRASQLAWRPERLRLYQRAQALLADEVPWIPLYVQLHWVVARPGVRDLRLHPSGFHRLDKVSLEPESQRGLLR